MKLNIHSEKIRQRLIGQSVLDGRSPTEIATHAIAEYFKSIDAQEAQEKVNDNTEYSSRG
jgi:hypothetical protein